MLLQKYGTAEERQVAQLIYDDSVELALGDQRLNLLAAHTYNGTLCEKIFAMLEKVLTELADHSWRNVHKALLILYTIVQFGSELAIDKSVDMCKWVHPLQV
jgi:hypothetical protein